MGKVIFSLVFSFCITVARQINGEGHLHFPGGGEVLFFFFMALCAFGAFAVLDRPLEKLGRRLLFEAAARNDSKPFFARAIPVFLFLTSAYAVVLWGVYPGFFTYDACTELMLYIKDANTTWHPLFHTLTTGRVITFFQSINDNYNQGIFAYILIQMLLFSAAFTFFYFELVRYGIPRMARRLCLFFLGFFPPVVMYVLCSCTDSMFIFGVFMYSLQLLALFCTPEIFRKQPYRFALLLLFSALFMLYRKNGVYNMVVFAPLLLLFGKKEYRLRLGLLSIAGILLYFAINSALIAGMRAEKNGQQEAFAVPLQQLGRVYRDFPEDFEEADLAYLDSLQSLDKWGNYHDKIADYLKEEVDGKVILADPAAFLSVYFKFFAKHPVTYVDAWLLTSYEMWYPGAIFDAFAGQPPYEEISYFAWVTDQPGWRNYAVNYIDKTYRAISVRSWPHRIPVLRFIWSPGTWFWLMIAGSIYVYGRGNKNFFKAFLLIIVIFLSMMLAPGSFVRYVAYVFFMAPVLLCGMLFPANFRTTEEEGSEDTGNILAA